MSKIVLLGYSRTQSRGSTSLPPSSTYTGCRSSPVYRTKYSSLPTSPSMPLPPSTYRTSFTHMPHPGTCGPQTLACLPPPAPNCEPSGTEPTVWQPPPSGTLSLRRSATSPHSTPSKGPQVPSVRQGFRPLIDLLFCLSDFCFVMFVFALLLVKRPWVP